MLTLLVLFEDRGRGGSKVALIALVGDALVLVLVMVLKAVTRCA